MPPCGGHPLAFDGNGLINMFQVVPPCGGHRSGKSTLMVRLAVSSRAPVWGASHTEDKKVHRHRVSSRAPVWGASFGRLLSRN